MNYLSPPDFLQSPLIAAVLTRDVEIVKVLLSSTTVKVDVNMCNAAGESALAICVKECLFVRPSSDLLVIAAVLLRAKAKKNNKEINNSVGPTPLELVKLHRRQTNTSQNQQNKPSDKESVNEIVEDMCALIEYDCSSHKIYELARDKNLRGVKALLMQGVDVNDQCPSKRYTALIGAVYNKDFEMIELLLQAEDIFLLTESSNTDLWFMSSSGEPTNVDDSAPNNESGASIHLCAKSYIVYCFT